MKLRSEENKWKIIDRKRRLKGTDIWTKEDKTFSERKIEWKRRLRRIAKEERKTEKKVKKGKVRIWIKDRWFYWLDEIEDVRCGKERRSGDKGRKKTAGEEERRQCNRRRGSAKGMRKGERKEEEEGKNGKKVRKRGEERESEKGRREYSVAFWNMAGPNNKDRDYLERVRKIGYNYTNRNIDR